jgi:predicted ribosome quality control (RQC) complex YloA/Tae2 family protein
VSNPIRYDPLLVRALAAELHRTLAGRAAHPLPRFDSDRSATLFLDRGEALRLDLHPRRGWVRIVPRPAGTDALHADARIVRVAAPPDERLLRIHLAEGSRFRGARRTLVVELHTNQWNALLVDDAGGRIVSVLQARDAGARALHTGAAYHPPPPAGRIAPDPVRREEIRALWMDVLSAAAPERRQVEAVRRFAWLSPLNATAVLGAAAREPADAVLEAAFERWWTLAEPADARPVLLRTPRGAQPYPAPLADVAGEPQPTLLAAMAAAAEADEAPADAAEPELAAPARERLAAAERRLARLREEQAAAGDAEPVRALGDVLLSHLHRVEPGAASVVLPDFAGGEVEIALDPALRPHENAERYYARARRLSRAQARLPELISTARREVDRWSAAVEAAERDEPHSWLAAAVWRTAREGSAARSDEGERLPYRAFRTSGGLEVRVGRSSRDNDRLTFGHSAPGDVWLHARSVAGSHVVLRWRADGAPPARDLEEAAVLAALYSKARTSGTVAVDWTRRRHVRKPRGAPPGRVVLQRAQTVFVAPDPAVETRLAAG